MVRRNVNNFSKNHIYGRDSVGSVTTQNDFAPMSGAFPDSHPWDGRLASRRGA